MSADDSPSPLLFDPETRPAGVLVGFDGSDQAIQALHYGATMALGFGCRLTVVAAFTVPPLVYPNLASMPAVPEDEARAAASRQVAAGALPHLEGYPGEVSLQSVEGDAAGVLVELSGQARLAVVGSRGRGGFLGRLLGSVSEALPAHAHCPTVVVPAGYEVPESTGRERFTETPASGPVVVGLDGSGSEEVTTIAMRTAVAAGVPLHLLQVLPPLDAWSVSAQAMVVDQQFLDRQREELAGVLEAEARALQERVPGSTVSGSVEIGDPVTLLVERSRTARLTVVGTRGRGRLLSALLGSVSRGLLERAEGPVMVVPDLDVSRIGHDPRRPR
jgi:nucleotide-binding universal stress UspA family protein